MQRGSCRRLLTKWSFLVIKYDYAAIIGLNNHEPIADELVNGACKPASLSIWSLCFVLPTRFCVPECHRNRVESSTAEKVFFLSVSSFEIVKVQVGIDLGKCVSDCI